MESHGPRVSEDVLSPKEPAFLNGCLMEGDPALERGARKLKRRAVFVSILLQLAVVATLVLYPLLSKGENITAVIQPGVPHIFTAHHSSAPLQAVQPHTVRNVCLFCAPNRVPTVTVVHDPTVANSDPDPTSDLRGVPEGPGGGIPGGDLLSSAPPPARPEPVQPQKRRIIGTLESAMLIHRVEPEFPRLARQVGRGGRVELHAIIATDGTVQSLEVVAGDPLFFQSALAAVREWRYRPTILNGQPVEVDTHITVIYTVAH